MSTNPAPAIYRMPLGYGPTPGPRQTSNASPIADADWVKVKSTTYTIAFTAPTSQLASFLPHPSFSITSPSSDSDSALSTASVSFTRLENLPWLAGHGYSHCGLYIHDVVCRGRNESIAGNYLSVLFENRADPITSGREELGFSKFYAELEDAMHRDNSTTISMGWEGAIFGEIKVGGQRGTGDEINIKRVFQPRNVLHYKYIPRTGSPGVADVEYPTVSPLPCPHAAAKVEVEEEYYTTQTDLRFKDLGFMQLPTLHHIAAKLAGIEVVEVLGARTIIAKGASDFSTQRPIAL